MVRGFELGGEFHQIEDTGSFEPSISGACLREKRAPGSETDKGLETLQGNIRGLCLQTGI